MKFPVRPTGPGAALSGKEAIFEGKHFTFIFIFFFVVILIKRKPRRRNEFTNKLKVTKIIKIS